MAEALLDALAHTLEEINPRNFATHWPMRKALLTRAKTNILVNTLGDM